MADRIFLLFYTLIIKPNNLLSMKSDRHNILTWIIFIFILTPIFSAAQYPEAQNELDKKVLSFLNDQSGQWRDMNIPVTDGRILYDLILEGKYTSALEIGTSTGHSAVWIAWALSKTGGKLITIEIDKKRYVQALANFRKAGLSEYIDARLGDAHDLVPSLEGKYDFVFCDADKWWYKNYFIAMESKMQKGGCFVAHNTNMRSADIREFLAYIEKNPAYTTRHDRNSRSGLSISCKK
ncbi:predicted O-methyltransferase YrrM [Bacteroidales bacterium 6E]|nr:predicted O-methyltransferase YrrM [Bacteroidales bacterium 6E]